MAFLVTHFADRLGAADLDAVHLLGDDHFLFHHLFADLVIPDLDLHPPVERPALLGRIGGDRLAVAYPFIGDGFRSKTEGALAIFGGGARPFPGQAGIVTVFRFQGADELLGVGVADKVKTHVEVAAHLFEHAAQLRHIFLGNVRLTRAETDGGDQTRQFDRFHFLFSDLAFLRAVPLVLRKNGRIKEPGSECPVLRQVSFSRFAAGSSLPCSRARTRGRRRRSHRTDGGLRSGHGHKEHKCKGDTTFHNCSHQH